MAKYLDSGTADRRICTTPRYALGLIPQTQDNFNPATANAVQERVTALRNRAAILLRRAVSQHEPWITELCPRPSAIKDAREWDDMALSVAAYRDAWAVDSQKPLGEPLCVLQRQDSSRIGVMLDRLQRQFRTSGQIASSPVIDVQTL